MVLGGCISIVEKGGTWALFRNILAILLRLLFSPYGYLYSSVS